MKTLFPRLFRFPSLSALLLGIAALSGCANSSKVVFHEEDFDSANTFSHSFPGTPKAICEAARRTLLSQGYVVEEAKGDTVKGRKNFQPAREQHVQIEFTVVCAANNAGSNTSTAFANALEDRYTLKKNVNSASVGVSVLGSLSVPFGSSDDSLVKTGSETISKDRFYKRFFALMERYLDSQPGTAKLTDEPAERPENEAAGTTD